MYSWACQDLQLQVKLWDVGFRQQKDTRRCFLGIKVLKRKMIFQISLRTERQREPERKRPRTETATATARERDEGKAARTSQTAGGLGFRVQGLGFRV